MWTGEFLDTDHASSLRNPTDLGTGYRSARMRSSAHLSSSSRSPLEATMATTTTPPLTIEPLATLSPPNSSRAWQSAPHPYLPLVATASSDKSIAIYSLTSFTKLTSITGGHKRSVRSVAWKPGMRGDRESILASGSFDAAAGIWKADNDRGIMQGEAQQGEGGDADDEDFRFAVILEGHESEIKSVAWSCHGTFLATCSRDKSVWVWEALDEGAMNAGPTIAGEDDDNYETVAVMQEHEGDVKSIAWHPTEEQCLASASYDDMVRVWREDTDGEWGCVGVCNGHEGTVWCVVWEPERSEGLKDGEVKKETEQGMEISGPRLLSCSDDRTLRVWRRRPKARPKLPTGPKIPSIIRTAGDDESWFEEGRLPTRHERAVYAVAWSARTGRVVSCGSDGMIVVYEERPNETQGDATMLDDKAEASASNTNWVILAELEAAHGVYEVNHVTWAKRYDRGKTRDEEEVIVSTGDDGEVKVWTVEGQLEHISTTTP